MPVANDTVFSFCQEYFAGNAAFHPPPVLLRYGSSSEEITGITGQVESLFRKNIAPSGVAVIYAESEARIKLEQSFHERNILFCNVETIDALQHPFIQKIIKLLSYINQATSSPGNSDHLLFDILHFDFYKIPVVEIAKLAIETGKKTNRTATNMYERLIQKANAPARDLFDPGTDPQLKDLAALLQQLFAVAATSNPFVLFEMITQDLSMINYFAENPEANWIRQLADALGNFIKECIIAAPSMQLHDLIERLYRMQKEQLPLTVSKLSAHLQGVQLIHFLADKEMDFGYIFLMGSPMLTDERKDWLKTFLKCLTNVHQPIVCISCVQPADEIAQPAIAAPPGIPANKIWSPEIAPLEESIMAALVSKIVLSVSALNTYLNCPLGFFYKNLLRVPKHTNEAMEFGSAIHYALEKLFRRLTSENLAGATVKRERQLFTTTMLEDFNNYMQNSRAFFNPDAFSRKLQYGQEVLLNYYDRYCDEWNTVVSIERNISGVLINGVPIKGKPDKLEFNGREVTIIDYKTGSIEKALVRLRPPSATDPHGGSYWRQAVFYKLLVDNYTQKDWHVTGAEFDFIEPGQDGSYHREKVHFTPADTETLKQQITGTWAKISARNFYTGCGQTDCHWCNLVKNNGRAIALHSRETNNRAD